MPTNDGEHWTDPVGPATCLPSTLLRRSWKLLSGLRASQARLEDLDDLVVPAALRMLKGRLTLGVQPKYVSIVSVCLQSCEQCTRSKVVQEGLLTNLVEPSAIIGFEVLRVAVMM